MTGMLVTGALTATTQKVNVARNNPPLTATLMSIAPGRGMRFSTSRSGADNTFFSPASGFYDSDTQGAISWVATAPIIWVEFTGNIGDTYEVL